MVYQTAYFSDATLTFSSYTRNCEGDPMPLMLVVQYFTKSECYVIHHICRTNVADLRKLIVLLRKKRNFWVFARHCTLTIYIFLDSLTINEWGHHDKQSHPYLSCKCF